MSTFTGTAFAGFNRKPPSLEGLSERQYNRLLSLLGTTELDGFTEKLAGKLSVSNWIIDSGASNHVTGNLNLLCDSMNIFGFPDVLPDGKISSFVKRDAQTGVCYGMLGSSLPQASQVINLYKQNNIRRMRLYDPYNQAALQALGGSGIEVMLGVPNIKDLQFVAANQGNANSWVQNNILKYPNVNFKYIAVGNEVSPRKSDTSQYVSYVVPAMRNIQNAISSAGLSGRIKVSTSVETELTENSYPPSHGVFRSDVRQYVNDIVQFLLQNNSPLLVNIYPYFALAGQPSIGLDYALFRSAGIDTPDGKYQNLFYAMLDAVYAALEKFGAPNMQIVVSETGWPTEGGYETTVDNARTYNSNLIQRVKNRSPRRPGRPIETYIFAMFDENQKGGGVETHWGIFSPNQQAKYSLNFN